MQSEPPTSSARALYVHVPFCVRKCRYCDFFSVVHRPDLVQTYLSALASELHHRVPILKTKTLYVGGGTPTALSAEELAELLRIVRAGQNLSELREFTVEANPGTIDVASLAALREAGVNRLSLGVQSFNPKILKALGRIHDDVEAVQAIERTREAGFDNLSIDIMFGIPGQSLDDVRSDVAEALAQDVEHISIYGLTFEEGTPLRADLERGVVHEVPEEVQLEMYRMIRALMQAGGFEHYEISNFARPGRRCLHNQVYWRNDSYVGVGPGAVSYINNRRASNVKDIAEYARRVSETGLAVQECECMTGRRRAGETVMLGLRCTEGLCVKDFTARTGFTLQELAGPELDGLLEMGLLERESGRIRLTERGQEVADSVLSEFL